MKIQLENVTPAGIENRSMEIISQELRSRGIILDQKKAPVIKRAIHASADFDYAENLYFSDNVIPHTLNLLRNGTSIVTDTKMALSGINKKILLEYGIGIYNFIDDKDVATAAKKNNTTRSAACIDKAVSLRKPFIFVIGNAPTALIRIYELYSEGLLKPELIIGVPVGFVNVVQAKELIIQTGLPCIIARGRKGGSNIAAAICNALLYML
ncbi:MAG: precorrin-8X methylmutase [Lachnospiraceae bacterium]|nr:precorrin-8X methylmutase [Lachnospiraceae bacterium]